MEEKKGGMEEGLEEWKKREEDDQDLCRTFLQKRGRDRRGEG